jgi:putative ABC transport system permease protein
VAVSHDVATQDSVRTIDALHRLLILVQPKSDSDIPYITEQVALLGYLAQTNTDFRGGIENYLIYKTGIGTNTLLMTVISFLVGLSICGQTFYSTSATGTR